MLGDRLQELIQSLGIKKGDFATKVGFSQGYISMILNGKRPNPSERFFEAVSREYQVNIDWLRDGKGEMFSIPIADMSAADIQLIKKYRLLTSYDKKAVDRIVDNLVIKCLTDKKNGLRLTTKTQLIMAREMNIALTDAELYLASIHGIELRQMELIRANHYKEKMAAQPQQEVLTKLALALQYNDR